MGHSRSKAAAIAAAAIAALAAAVLAGLMLSGCSFDTRPGAALAQRHDPANLVHLIGDSAPRRVEHDAGELGQGAVDAHVLEHDAGATLERDASSRQAPQGDGAAVTSPSQMDPDTGSPASIPDAGELVDASRVLEHDAGASDAGDPRWRLDATITNDAGEQFHVCRDRCSDGGWQCPNGLGGYSCSSSPACYCTGPAP